MVWADPAKKDISDLLKRELVQIASQLELSQSLEDLDIFSLLEKPPETKLGDFALPCFRFAKILRKKPLEIAKQLKVALEAQSCPWFERCELAGAFLNIFLNKKYFSEFTIGKVLNGKWFSQGTLSDSKNSKVMVEFSQPNTHKEFHIGHGRNVALGDSLCRILSYNGYQVTPVNYIGDEGTHVAKCLLAVEEYAGEAEEPYTQWYGQRYQESHEKSSHLEGAEKKKYHDKISFILAELESKSGKYYDMWLKSRKHCLDDFEQIYQWLDIKFDHIFFESDVSESSQKIVDEYIEKGLFSESDGAYGINMESDGLGFFMARKSDGTSLYITKDLALAKTKFQDFDIDRSIYVVGSEQKFHFKQLFKALELMGFAQAKYCHHLSYAHVTLPEGKISSRKGNTVNLRHLISLTNEEINKYLGKYEEKWEKSELDATAKKLAVAAIKYGMLSADPQKEITFDSQAWTSFDGNSGPYLLYSYSRTQSILKESAARGFLPDAASTAALEHTLEQELIRHIYDFNNNVKQACDLYKPSVVAHYLFDLCKSFNRFYAQLSVLKAESAELITARTTLVAAFAKTLCQGLNLLGMVPPARM